MKQVFFSLAIVASILTVQSCDKLFGGNGNYNLPSSVEITRIDNFSGAKGLAIMQSGAGAQTKAGEDGGPVNLCIIDQDGNSHVASFHLDQHGRCSNKVWNSIIKNISFVPVYITRIYDNFILLQELWFRIDYDWWLDAEDDNEIEAINDLLHYLHGDFLLRISDGALFKSPFPEGSTYIPDGDVDRCFRMAPDGETMIAGGNYREFGDIRFKPVIVKDAGDELIVKRLPEELNAPRARGFMVTEEGRLFCLERDASNTISYDIDLNPLYLDLSWSAQWLAGLESSFSLYKDGKLYLVTCEGGYGGGTITLDIYEVYLNGYSIEATKMTTCNIESGEEMFRRLFMEPWEPPYEDYHNPIIIQNTAKGKKYYYTGGFLEININEGKIINDRFPSNFPQRVIDYDSNGFAWEITDNYTTITKYDINQRTTNTKPIQWGSIDLGQFYNLTYSSAPGLFYVCGHNRDLTYSLFIVDAETGVVTEGGKSTNAVAPVITSYLRLN